MIVEILKYVGLYGFSFADLVFSAAALGLIVGLTKLYTRKRTRG